MDLVYPLWVWVVVDWRIVSDCDLDPEVEILCPREEHDRVDLTHCECSLYPIASRSGSRTEPRHLGLELMVLHLVLQRFDHCELFLRYTCGKREEAYVPLVHYSAVVLSVKAHPLIESCEDHFAGAAKGLLRFPFCDREG